MPRKVIARWKDELSKIDDEQAHAQIRKRISEYEDAGEGACWLRDSFNAEIVQTALKHSDQERYKLLEWCIMPNHVHALIRVHENHSTEQIVRSWKNFTARRINQHIGKQGRLWEPDYFDRLIRDEEHLVRATRYIRMNPVKAGLCKAPEHWRWSSAWTGH